MSRPECLPQAHRYDVSDYHPDVLICRRCGRRQWALAKMRGRVPLPPEPNR